MAVHSRYERSKHTIPLTDLLTDFKMENIYIACLVVYINYIISIINSRNLFQLDDVTRRLVWKKVEFLIQRYLQVLPTKLNLLAHKMPGQQTICIISLNIRRTVHNKRNWFGKDLTKNFEYLKCAQGNKHSTNTTIKRR